MGIVAVDALFLLYRRMDMLFVEHRFAVFVTGIAQLLLADPQVDAADQPVRPVTGFAPVLGNGGMHDFCRFKLLRLLLVTVNTLLLDNAPHLFLTGSWADQDDANKQSETT